MAKRTPIPKQVETAVLTKCRRRCCLCFYLSRRDDVRKGQIAHLNKDRTDHRPENLAFLCLEHHDDFDGTTSQSKGLTAAEVRHYRDRLHEHYQALETTVSPTAAEPATSETDEGGLDHRQREHLRRVATARLKEWNRLRADFEAEAKTYPALTLTVYIYEKGKPFTDEKFGRPNHAVTLWQFVADVDQLQHVAFSRFGLRDTQMTALGVIIGEKTDHFVRLATRAGSLLPEVLSKEIADNVARLRGKPNAKWLFVHNDAPLAKWLNLVLVSTVAFHPERVRSNTLPVDPFAASLSAFDLILPGVG